MRLRVTILLAALAVASGASASWTQAVASGGPTNVAVHSSRDASRDHLYLTRNIAHTILKWDGSTLTSFAGPTGSSMDTSLTVDVDETDNAIYVSGAKSWSPDDGVRCRAALPLTGTPTWTCHVSDANKYAANAIRLAYGGATYLTAYLSAPGAATAAIQRRSTWNGTATTVQALHAGSPDGGIIGFLVKLSESLALAVAPIASSNDVDIVSVTNDPSDAAGRTKRNNVTSGSVNSQRSRTRSARTSCGRRPMVRTPTSRPRRPIARSRTRRRSQACRTFAWARRSAARSTERLG